MAHLGQLALTQLSPHPRPKLRNRLPFGCRTTMTGIAVYATTSGSSSCAAALVAAAFILLAWGLIRFPAKISFVICAKAIRSNAQRASLFWPSRTPSSVHLQLATSTSIRSAWDLLKRASGARFARGIAVQVAKKKRHPVSGQASLLLVPASSVIMFGIRNVCQLKLSLFSI